MKALVVTFKTKHIVLRNAERKSKGNMMKLIMTAGNEAWTNDDNTRRHYESYAEFINYLMKLKAFFKVTKVDIHYSHTFEKWVIQSPYWMGKYSDDEIVFADVEANYRPFAPMD